MTDAELQAITDLPRVTRELMEARRLLRERVVQNDGWCYETGWEKRAREFLGGVLMLSRAEIERRLTLDPEGFIPPITPGEKAALETAKRLGEWLERAEIPSPDDRHECTCNDCQGAREIRDWLRGEE